jgi:putative transposase
VSAFIDDQKDAGFAVELICRTLGVSQSAYYERRCAERSARSIEDERLLAGIRELHEANYCAYGYRRMYKALGRAGEDVGRDRVRRLMGANDI